MTAPAWRLFERVADEYDQVLPFFEAYGQSIVDAIAPVAGARFLDVGAGRGALTGAALARGCRVTAIDAAPGMVTRLAVRFPTAHAAVMDARALGFGDARFDVVAAAFVLHLLDEPGRAAAQAHRVLVPGGRFALPMGSRPAGELSARLDDLFTEFASYRPPGSELGRPLSAPELLRAAGFDDIREDRAAVDVAVPDNPTLWRWAMSHGYRAFVEALPRQRQAEFRRRVLDLPRYDGALRRTTSVWSGRR